MTEYPLPRELFCTPLSHAAWNFWQKYAILWDSESIIWVATATYQTIYISPKKQA